MLVPTDSQPTIVTELPRVAGGSRPAADVRLALQELVAQDARFVQTEVTGLHPAAQQLLTADGPLRYTCLVLALGSEPNDFDIPGLAAHALSLYSTDDAEHVWAAVARSVQAAVHALRVGLIAGPRSGGLARVPA